MSIFVKSIHITLGVLLICLMHPSAWGAENSLQLSQVGQAYAVASENRKVAESDLHTTNNGAEISVTTNLSHPSSEPTEFGDGRSGFWIVGILINLSVLGWFLAWAVKEWRKKQDD